MAAREEGTARVERGFRAPCARRYFQLHLPGDGTGAHNHVQPCVMITRSRQQVVVVVSSSMSRRLAPRSKQYARRDA